MNIAEALQDKNNRLRICDGNRWLVGDGFDKWRVYERKPYARKTTLVIETEDESIAVEYLLKDSGG